MIDTKVAARAAMVAAVFGLSSLAAHAQGGFYVEGGVGVNAATTTLTGTDPIGSLTTTTDFGKSPIIGSIGAGWRWVGPTTVFGVGAFWNPGSRNVGEASITAPGSSITTKLQQRNHLGIGVEAGWRLAPPTTLYGKLGWHRANFKMTYTETDPLGAFSESINNNHTGVGIGVGLRHMLSQNAYVFAEWQHVNFSARTRTIEGVSSKVDPRNTIGLVGLGWRF